MTTEPSFKEKFSAEAIEHIAEVTAALMALERGDVDARLHIERSLRAAHSIKGGAGLVGLRTLESVAHAVETVIEDLRDGRLALTPSTTDRLLAAVDRMGAMVNDLDHSDQADVAGILAALLELSAQATHSDEPAKVHPPSTGSIELAVDAQAREFAISERIRSVVPPVGESLYGVKLDFFACERLRGLDAIQVALRLEQAGTIIDARCDLPGPSLRDGLATPPLWYRAIISSPRDLASFVRTLDIDCAAVIRLERPTAGNASSASKAAPESSPAARAAPASSLRVSIPIIDRVLELAGELSLVRNQSLSAASSKAAGQANDVARRQLLRRLDAVTNELQGAALRMRMQPVGQLFDRFPRLVRDLARQLGKHIEVEISGTDVELDKTVLELLSDPLTHLIRNCCDHGIETPETRTAQGKPEGGTIWLSARQDRGQILIEVRDNGRGIDVNAIKRKAVAQGLRTQSELDALEDRQVFDLILLSGFSTAARVTDVSGRGVGMDVVKTNVDQAGGSVEIDSEPGRGSVFLLRLPLTLAIMPGQLVECGGQRFAIPRRELCEVVLCDSSDKAVRVEVTQDQEVLRLRDELLPMIRLTKVLAGDAKAGSGAAVVPAGNGTIAADAEASPGRRYVAVLQVGSHRFGLLVDDLLWSEEIVVKPLHPLLRPLGIYSSATILADGSVGLILSSEGIARDAGIFHRSSAVAALPGPSPEARATPILLFRSGRQELFAIPLSDVRRVVMFDRSHIERIGEREMIQIEGETTSTVIRLERLFDVSPAADAATVFLVLPRGASSPVGILATEIVDTVAVPYEIDPRAFRVDGIVGSATIRGQTAVFLDVKRIADLWAGVADSQRALPGAIGGIASAGATRILVVEDTQFFQRLIAGHLQSAGYTVAVASNGVEGLEALAHAEFDLVISDIEMPVMNGYEFARSVRGDARIEHVPMLALTTLNNPEARGRAEAAGFDGFEAKLERESLLRHVALLLAPRGVPGGRTPPR